jgi:hypothetical protein
MPLSYYLGKLLAESAVIVLAFDTQQEASLTNLKTAWMPLVQKHAQRVTQKHGLLLLGLNKAGGQSPCEFAHKVALFQRGF